MTTIFFKKQGFTRINQYFIFFTASKRSCGKAMFSHLSVILSTMGVCIPGCTWAGLLWWKGMCGEGGMVKGGVVKGVMKKGCGNRGVVNGMSKGCTPPRETTGDGQHSGRYASYWNAFLLLHAFSTYLINKSRQCAMKKLNILLTI